MAMVCEHLFEAKPIPARTPGCEECLKRGTPWVHLRLCLTLRPRRLLRQLAGPARHAALPPARATRSSRPSSPANAGPGATSIEMELDVCRRNILPRTCVTEATASDEEPETCPSTTCEPSPSPSSTGPAGRAGAMPADDAQALSRRREALRGRACDRKFYVIKSGAVEIIDESGDEPKIVASSGPGEFTGDVTQLTGGPAIVSGIARGETRGLRGLARRPAPDPQRPPGPRRHHPAGVHRPPAPAARVGGLHGPARDRLALFAGHLPGPRVPRQEPACRSPGSTWKPTRRCSSSSSGSG